MIARTTIGIDLGMTAKHRVCAITPDQPDRTWSVRPTPAELDAVLDTLGGGDHVDAVLEPTGLSWVPVAAYLQQRGCRVSMLDTRKAHGFRKLFSRDVKSDQADARALARVGALTPEETRLLPALDGLLFMLARLMRSRESLVDDRTQIIQRIKSLLPAVLPTLAARLVARTLGPVELYLLSEYLDPEVVIEAGYEGLLAALKQAGHRTTQSFETLAREWLQAAEDTRTLYADRLPLEIAQLQMKVHLDHYDALGPLIERLDDQIAALYARLDPIGLIETLPGVGTVVGAGICAVLGSPTHIAERFPSASHLVSFAGLDPRKNQSGGNDRQGQHISKSGNRMLRRYLYLAAETARRRDLDLAEFYDRLVARGKHHKVAVVAIAAKLLRRLYAISKRAAAGDAKGYILRDDGNQTLSGRQAAEAVRTRYPSKAAQAKAQREAKAAKKAKRRAPSNTRQSEDSSTGSRPLGQVGDYTSVADRDSPKPGSSSRAKSDETACAGLRS